MTLLVVSRETKMTLSLRMRPAQPPEIGERTKDRLVYCGISPQTSLLFYAAPMDFMDACSWEFAMKHAPGRGWRVPTLEEMSIMYRLRHAIGGFDSEIYYWAGAPHYLNIGWAKNFFTGDQCITNKNHRLRVRLIRGPDPYIQR